MQGKPYSYPAILAQLQGNGHAPEEPEQDTTQQKVIHVYPLEGGGVVFTGTPLEDSEPIESIPPPSRDTRSLVFAGVFFLLLVTLIVASVLAPQPDTSKAFTVTVQGFSLVPVHKSVTVTAQATGKGYIAPTFATGEVTFYNAATYTQIIPVDTVLKGQDGVAVITNEQAVIPPVTQTIPPTDGTATVPAHALSPGTIGNIPAGDINEACCVTSVLVQNASAFSGGRDGQRFTYVTKQDVYKTVTPLLTQLERIVPQLFNSIALSPTCTPTIAASPPIGQRAERVSITATVSCKAVSYSPQSVQQAIQSYSSHFGKGELSNVAYQVIAIDKERISFFVTATWTLTVARPRFVGK